MVITDHSFIRVDSVADLLFAVAAYTEGGFPFWRSRILLPQDWKYVRQEEFPSGAVVYVAANEKTCSITDLATIKSLGRAVKRHLKEIELPTMWQLLNEPNLSSFF